MRTIPNAGTYPARTNGGIVIYEAPTGALCAAIPIRLHEVDPAWSGKHTMTIAKADGTLQARTIDTLKQLFGWDGLDPFALSDLDTSEAELEIVGEHSTYTPEGETEERLTFKIQWLNVPGEGGAKMPEPAERKSVLAKYAGKFRALAGAGAGKQATPAATTKPAATTTTKTAAPVETKKPAAAPPKKVSTPPGKAKSAGGQARTSTMDECWAKLQEQRADLTDEAALGEVWYNMMAASFPGKENADLSIQDWGTFMTEIESLAS